jgi:hypothetical protein
MAPVEERIAPSHEGEVGQENAAHLQAPDSGTGEEIAEDHVIDHHQGQNHGQNGKGLSQPFVETIDAIEHTCQSFHSINLQSMDNQGDPRVPLLSTRIYLANSLAILIS